MLVVPDVDSLRDELWRRLVEPCKNCRGTGYLAGDDADMVEPWDTSSASCPCQDEVARQCALLAGHVPREFWEVEGLEFTWNTGPREQVETYCASLRAHRAEGRGWVFLGENGTGKTACGSVILCRAVREGFSVGYITAQEYVSSAFAGQRDPELDAWRKQLAAADFLVLDELGKEYRKDGSEFALAELDGLLRWRRGELRPTVICTNYTVAQLQSSYGESLWSILLDRLDRLQFESGDFRRELGRGRRDRARGK